MKYLKHHVGASLLAALLLSGCIGSEPEKEVTTVKKSVFMKKEIRILPPDSSGRSVQQVSLVDGDSTVFVYSKYTDRGMEGDGNTFCFTIREDIDSNRHTPQSEPIFIVGFSTGFAMPFVDTLGDYDLEIVNRTGPLRIKGKVGGTDISGNYIRKVEVRTAQ